MSRRIGSGVARIRRLLVIDCNVTPALATWKQAPDRARERASETASVLAGLRKREREVLARIAADDSNKLIASSLNLSLRTVKHHVANILELDVPTRCAATALYRQNHRNIFLVPAAGAIMAL